VMRSARGPAWSLGILTLVVAAVGLALMVWDWSAPVPAGFFGIRGFTGLFAVCFGGVGALLTWRRPGHPVGWIFAAAGLVEAVDFATFEYGLAASAGRRHLPAAGYVGWVQLWLWVPFVALVTVYLFLLFPDGRLPSPRWRPVGWLAGGFTVLAIAGLSFIPGPEAPKLPALRNPFGVSPAAAPFDATIAGLAGLLCCVVLAAWSLVARARRGTEAARQQIKWLACSGCLVAVVLVPAVALSKTPGTPARVAAGAVFAAFVTVPAAVAVAVLKYRLYDLDIVVRKTVVAALVAGAFTAVYAIVVVAVGAVTGRPGSSPLTFAAAALAAVLLQPVRARAGLLADRLVYGRRATPYEVLSEFSGQMAGAYPVEDVLPRMAALIGEATGAERAEVWMRTRGTEQLAAAWPAQALSAPPGSPAAAPAPEPLAAPLPVTQAPPAPALTAAPEADRAQNGRARVFDVEHHGERLGSLRVTSSPREPLTAAGERLVQAVAGQAGLILRNVGLVQDLRASRQRLVAAADQARRDLERDLHDGAQQQIVALMAKLRLARNQLARDPAVAGQTLAEAQAEAQQTLQDLRELARGIHPSVLSDQGILAAVKSRIGRLPIGVRLTAGPALAGARYPDQIEGAAYFLVCEALVNVLKHARASRVQVTLSDDGSRLRVEITDDGAGFVPADAAGSGLTGLTDRIEAVGGSLSIRSRPGAGTRLAGELPARGRRPAGV